MTTAYAGELWDIDAFGQPGVEESKVSSHALLGNPRDKYTQKAQEIKKRTRSPQKYIL
jgi:glucose-6-phosphate isomerase